MNRQDLTLLTDLYELTMMQGYYAKGQHEKVIFDVFFRQNPCNNGYSVCAGLAPVLSAAVLSDSSMFSVGIFCIGTSPGRAGSAI